MTKRSTTQEPLIHHLKTPSLHSPHRLLANVARRDFLTEMCDPNMRMWVAFLQIYGENSLLPFLSYSQSDDPGVAFKAPRVIYSRLKYINRLASEQQDPLEEESFESMRDFLESHSGEVYDSNFSDTARGIVRDGAGAAAEYFGVNSAQWTGGEPHWRCALKRCKPNPALAVLGVMDEKGFASRAAEEVLGLATQGRLGIATAMLPHMPEGLKIDDLVDAIEVTTDGVCVAFHDESLEQASDHS